MPDLRGLNSKHFKVAHIVKPVVLTIKAIVSEEVGQQKQTKGVLYFTEDARGLVLNDTRYTALMAAHGGSELTEKYVGAVIELAVNPNVTFNGQRTGSIIIRVIKPAGEQVGE